MPSSRGRRQRLEGRRARPTGIGRLLLLRLLLRLLLLICLGGSVLAWLLHLMAAIFVRQSAGWRRLRRVAVVAEGLSGDCLYRGRWQGLLLVLLQLVMSWLRGRRRRRRLGGWPAAEQIIDIHSACCILHLLLAGYIAPDVTAPQLPSWIRCPAPGGLMHNVERYRSWAEMVMGGWRREDTRLQSKLFKRSSCC